MKFINDILNTIGNSEAFLIVISGVVIYTTQQLISQLWILPIKEFSKCKAKIETIMNRWDFLHYYTEGKSSNLIDSHGTMDERIKLFKKELNEIVTELIYSYNQLPRFEKWRLNILGTDVKSAKTSLLTLSANISKEGDWVTGDSKAKNEIDNIYKTLKLSAYLQSKF